MITETAKEPHKESTSASSKACSPQYRDYVTNELVMNVFVSACPHDNDLNTACLGLYPAFLVPDPGAVFGCWTELFSLLGSPRPCHLPCHLARASYSYSHTKTPAEQNSKYPWRAQQSQQRVLVDFCRASPKNTTDIA